MSTEKKLRFETLQLHVGQENPDPATDARAVPIYQTTSYVFRNSQHAADRFGLRDAGNIYGRLTNSTQGVFEDRVAALEGGVAGLAVASGAAAVTYALQNILQNGDHIVAADNIYGGTYNLITHTLSTQGVSYTIVDPRNFEQVEAAIQDNTKALYAETFGNPNSDVTDIDKLAEIAHRHNIPLIIDNTFGTPYLIRPIEHGADIVVHSATKFIGGHGSSLGGVIVDGGKFDWKANADKFPTLAKPDPSYHGAVFADVAGAAAFVTRIRAVILRDTGATISPFNAWILLQGLETLSLRVERHVQNALKVVEYLENNPKVAKVNHPAVPSHPDHELYKKLFPNGGGSIFTFDIKGGEKEAWEFIDHLRIFSLLANVADVKSLVIHPATTTHSQLSPEELEEQHIYPSTVRLSIGIENIDDLIEALDEDPATDARAVPIYQTTSYVFRNSQHAADRFGLRDAGNIYGRLTNSTQGVFEDRVAALEGGVAGLAVASGAAAVTYALQNILQNGDHIVAADNIYGGTYNLITHTLSTQGVSYTIVDPRNFEQVEAAIQDNTKALYAETFGNPNSDVTDIDKLAEIAHRHNIPLIIDNTFGTPYLIRPIEHGADIVVHSATKFIGGHGSSLGGVIVDGGKFDWKANADKFPTLAKPDPSYHGAVFADVAGAAAFVTRIRAVILRDTGATISPFNAWILLQGLETLSLRVERHVQNALKVVEYLENNPKVAKVNHPAVPSHPDHELYKKLFPNGGGSIFTFDIKGGEKEAWEFIDHLRIFSLLANVADVKSLVIHPATTTHSQLSPEELEEQHIYPSTVRLSIGIENIDDLIEALDEAFTYVK